MKPISFHAETAEAALAQIESELGPDAVVISVRRLPAHGLARLWHRHGQIEVLARAPDSTPTRRVHTVPPGEDAYVPFGDKVEPCSCGAQVPVRHWRSISWLESLGLLSQYADELERRVAATHGLTPPEMPIAEWHAVRETLATFWRAPHPPQAGSGRPQVFIGPPGSGKTTALCKWITQLRLAEDHSVRVSRLDNHTANTSEFLSLHCELIGIPVERFWSEPTSSAEFLFVDLPGVDGHDQDAMTALREQLSGVPNPQIHLVLNAAYESAILFEQFHAFASFAPNDLIFTHLDEERHRVKLWNFVLGTNCSLSHLSAGQKIPGEFRRAESDLLFPNRKSL